MNHPQKMTKSPEIILVTSRGGKAELERTGSSLLINPTVSLLNFPDDSYSELGQMLDTQRLLIPGAMLIRSPYNRQKYSLADKANENFLREKHFLTSLIAGLIGARLVSIQQIEIVEGDKAHAVTLDGKYHNVGGTVKIEDKETNSVLSDMHLIDEYAANSRQITEAWKICAEHGLSNDDNITTLIKAAELGLLRKKRQVLLTVAHDARHAFSVAASLDVPTVVKIDIGYQQSIRNRREYRLLLNIEFHSSST